MPINAGLMNALVRPVRSVQDYQDDYTRQDIQAQGLQRNALLLQEGRALQQDRERTRMDGDTLRNALQALPPGSTYDQRISAMEGTNLPAGYTQADALRQALMKQRQGAATAGKIEQETEAGATKLQFERDDRWRKLVQSAEDPQHAMELVVGAARQKLLSEPDAMQFISRLSQDPAKFAQQKAAALAPALSADKLLPSNGHVGLGGSMGFTSTDPWGRVTMTGSQPITQSADNRATVGASMANAAAVRDAAKTTADGVRDAAKSKRDQDTEMKLADDYRAQSKEFGQAKSAYEQLNATLASATTSPAATLAAATKFMKILDPGSVVRESELGMALAASGVLDRAMNYVSTLQSGKKLTATQAADFKNISDKMFVAAQKVQQSIDTDYKGKAKTYGLRPEMVTQDLGQNASAIPPAVAAALAKHGDK